MRNPYLYNTGLKVKRNGIQQKLFPIVTGTIPLQSNRHGHLVKMKQGSQSTLQITKQASLQKNNMNISCW